MSIAEVEAFGSSREHVAGIFSQERQRIDLAVTGWRNVSVYRVSNSDGEYFTLMAQVVGQPAIALTRYMPVQGGEVRGIYLYGLPAAFADGNTVTGLSCIVYPDDPKIGMQVKSLNFYDGGPKEYLDVTLSRQGMPTITAEYLQHVPSRIHFYKSFEALRNMVGTYLSDGHSLDSMPLEYTELLVRA